MGKENEKTIVELTPGKIREIAITLRRLADIFEESAAHIEKAGIEKVMARSTKTMETGVENVRTGAKRIQEAVFEAVTPKVELPESAGDAIAQVIDYEKQTAKKTGIHDQQKKAFAAKVAEKDGQYSKPKKKE